MKIEVLGPGCAKCYKTEDLVRKVATEEKVDADIKHITDVNELANRGVMMTPAVMIDGETKIAGKVPSEDEVRSWFGG